MYTSQKSLCTYTHFHHTYENSLFAYAQTPIYTTQTVWAHICAYSCSIYLLNPFLLYLYSVEVIFYILVVLRTVGLLGRVFSSSQGLYLNTGQQKTQNKYVLIPNIHALYGIQNHDPRFRVRENSTCLRLLGYCDRPVPFTVREKYTHST
jgi:hypothetical protein